MSLNRSISLLPSAQRTATNSTVFQNNGNVGMVLFFDVTAVPGTDTVTVKIEGYDSNTDTAYDILVAPARVATGTDVLKVYPGLTASANAVASDIIPTEFRITVTHSAASNFTYSARAALI